MHGVLLCCLACQAHRGAPWLGSYSVDWHVRHLKGLPGWGPTLVQCVRHMMGQPLYCSAADAVRWGERGYVMALPTTCDSAVSLCFHGCLAFLHWHFTPQSPPSHPLDPSLCSQWQLLSWDCSTIPKFQFLAAAPSRGPVSLSGVCAAAARTV